MSKPVGWLLGRDSDKRQPCIREVMRSAQAGQRGNPQLPRKAACGVSVVTVLQTDSGGRGEYPKARERTLVKELGKLTP